MNHKINDDAEVLMVCHPHTAMEFMQEGSDIIDTLVMTTVLPEDEVVIVEKDEFITWLKGDDDEVQD